MGRWDDAGTVGSFASAKPNAVLMAWAAAELARRRGAARVLDLGCGAARNTGPLAALGAEVVGTDLSLPMLAAARARVDAAGLGRRVELLRAGMDRLPLGDGVFDVVIAHGIWNLARSGDELRRALAEAARVARRGAGLFVFTFSRHTLPPAAEPVAGETFVYTQFSGEPQVFLEEPELVALLAEAGFVRDPPGPLTEYNRAPSPVRVATGPVIWEGTFRREANRSS
ncbi:MAG: class I SAM-dependent methyltransferase [Anaeromyxobacteraceae bacterium]